jgi:hypothetical protein
MRRCTLAAKSGEAAPHDVDIASGEARPNMPSDAPGDSKRLVLAHRRLSQTVAPATPRVIMYLQREAQSKSPLDPCRSSGI